MKAFYKCLAILCVLALPLAVGGCNTCTEADETRLDELNNDINDLIERSRELSDAMQDALGDGNDELYEELLEEYNDVVDEYNDKSEEMGELRGKCPDWAPDPNGSAPQSDGGEAAAGDDGVTPIMDGDKAVGAGGEGGTVTLR